MVSHPDRGSTTAKPIADQLVSLGHAVHPYLRILYGLLTPGLACQLGVTAQSGLAIVAVAAGSPAAQAGLWPGDVITAIDSQTLTDESSLAQILSQYQPGDSLSLTVLRGCQQLTVQVWLGQAATLTGLAHQRRELQCGPPQRLASSHSL